MLVTTTSTLEGRAMDRYIGLVGSEAIPGADAFRDFPARRRA